MPSVPGSSAACSLPRCWRCSSCRCSSWRCCAGCASGRSLPTTKHPRHACLCRRENREMRKLTVALIAALLAAGCTLEPKYERPAAPVPQRFPEGEAYRAGTVAPTTGKAAADIGWREFFTDPRLQQLIELALANNRDLRVAALNVEAQRAQYRIQRADLLPTISPTANESAQSVPPYLNKPGLPIPPTIRQYTVGVGFTSYELDLFGRIRSLTHQQLETYFGYQETRRSTQISLVAEVADGYLTLLADQELLRITE